jgi:hypothetical protein
MKKNGATHERKKLTAEQYLQALYSDIDPAKYAGEGWYATEEYDPATIRDPYTLGDIMNQDAYYPRPIIRKRRK